MRTNVPFAMILLSFATGDAQERQGSSVGVGERISICIMQLDSARSTRIRAALRSVPSPVQGTNILEQMRSSRDTKVALDELSNERAVEAIPVLTQFLTREAFAGGLSGDQAVSPFAGYPAARALANIGAVALPAVMEKVINLDELPEIRERSLSGTPTHMLLLNTMYEAAGEVQVVNDALRYELEGLRRVDRRSDRTSQQIANLEKLWSDAYEYNEWELAKLRGEALEKELNKRLKYGRIKR